MSYFGLGLLGEAVPALPGVLVNPVFIFSMRVLWSDKLHSGRQ